MYPKVKEGNQRVSFRVLTMHKRLQGRVLNHIKQQPCRNLRGESTINVFNSSDLSSSERLGYLLESQHHVEPTQSSATVNQHLPK